METLRWSKARRLRIRPPPMTPGSRSAPIGRRPREETRGPCRFGEGEGFGVPRWGAVALYGAERRRVREAVSARRVTIADAGL